MTSTSWWQKRTWTRTALIGAAAGLFLILSGDRSAYLATGGIDPLEILKLQIKPNVLVILDTSGSMQETGAVSNDTYAVGGDNQFSKMGQAKHALNIILEANKASINFGFATYFAANNAKELSRSTYGGTSALIEYVALWNSTATSADTWTGGQTPDFFRATRSATPADYNGSNGADVYESFQSRNRMHTNDARGDLCGPGTSFTAGPCRAYLASRFVRDSTRFKWVTTTNPPTLTGGFAANTVLTSATSITCPAQPLALFPYDDANNDGTPDFQRPCVEMENSAGVVTTFWYVTATWQGDGTTASNNCNGAALRAAVAACNQDNSGIIATALKPELPLDGSCTTAAGVPCNLPPVTTASTAPYTTLDGTKPGGVNQDTLLGAIAAGNTPLGMSLRYVRQNYGTVFPNHVPDQADFIILITDGLDTCYGADASTEAGLIYPEIVGTKPVTETFVVGLALDSPELNQIANAGSNGKRPTAFTAADADALVAALQAVIDQAASEGSFASASQQMGTVFELVQDLPATTTVESPYDPTTRYGQRVNLLYQPIFGMPSWEGHLFAYRNDATLQPVPDNVNYTGNWDAGESLFEEVSQVMESQQRGSGRQVNQFTFDELHAGATVDTMHAQDPAGGGALIRRRVFTSNGNSAFPRTGSNDDQFDASRPDGRNVVALWPPNQTGLSSGITEIDPAAGSVGPLDDALGIGPGSIPLLSFNDLQGKLGACDVSNELAITSLPAGCMSADAATQLNAARKEARQILLAWIAGAKLATGGDNLPLRAADKSWELLYRDRGWILKDSTVTTPAILGPPMEMDPAAYFNEAMLFMDGPRNASNQGIAAIDQGFGLTNPDRDDSNPTTKIDLKPVMTVVYLGANDGLHAFSAYNSEELWSFVPYDQLDKIQRLINPGQARSPHIYMIASAIRVGPVFLPDVNGFTYSFGSGVPVTFKGRWRQIAVFGRGPGGKFYTALDVTSPGPFTRPVLETNPPWVMWSRGNPDQADPANYATMGEAWSIPAIGEVLGGVPSPSDPTGPTLEYRIFTGSGYGDLPTEGTTLYELKVDTGDVLLAKDVSSGSGVYVARNALVAPPALYNPRSLDPPYTLDPDPKNYVTQGYIPDIHGRVWRFDTTSGSLLADLGPTQPFGDGPALLKLNAKPLVFVESGWDSRVPDSVAPFRMYGYRDDYPDVPSTVSLFTFDFPTSYQGSSIPYRGQSRPATAYVLDASAQLRGLVIFAGIRFNPATADCISTFDSILYAVRTGWQPNDYGPGYNFDTSTPGLELSAHLDNAWKDPQITGGQLVLTSGGTKESPPPPGGCASGAFNCPASPPGPIQPSPPTLVPKKVYPNPPVCRTQ